MWRGFQHFLALKPLVYNALLKLSKHGASGVKLETPQCPQFHPLGTSPQFLYTWRAVPVRLRFIEVSSAN